MSDYIKYKKISDLDSILILSDEFDQSSKVLLRKEILKINDLISKKYFLKKQNEYKTINKEEKNLREVKKSVYQLNNKVKEHNLEIINSIEIQKAQLERLNKEEIFFEKKNISLDIINNQKELIKEYKLNNNKLKLNLESLEKKLENTTNSNKELKSILRRYVTHNKKIQNDNHLLEQNLAEASIEKQKTDKIITQVKFYQDENMRLSSEIFEIKSNYELIKNNLTEVNDEKNIIYKQIQELNNSLIKKNNIIGTPFVKKTIKEDSINSKVLNDITDTNLKLEIKKSEESNNLDDEINNIFK